MRDAPGLLATTAVGAAGGDAALRATPLQAPMRNADSSFFEVNAGFRVSLGAVISPFLADTAEVQLPLRAAEPLFFAVNLGVAQLL